MTLVLLFLGARIFGCKKRVHSRAVGTYLEGGGEGPTYQLGLHVCMYRPVASQPGGGGGGLNLDGWNTRRTPPPPLDIVRVTSSI